MIPTEIMELIKVLEEHRDIKEIDYDDPKSRLHIRVVSHPKEADHGH